MEVWRSVFFFLSVRFNRQTCIHRDAGGMRGGLDALFLAGRFTGGDLYLQDFGLVVEWGNGDFCCFDGKTFIHAVQPWEGTERNCFIYFTHANVAKYFYLPGSVPLPHVAAFALVNGLCPVLCTDAVTGDFCMLSTVVSHLHLTQMASHGLEMLPQILACWIPRDLPD